MSGQSSMQAMTRQLAGNQLPKPEVGSAAGNPGFSEGAQDFLNATMLQDAARENNPAEKLPARLQTLDGRGQFRTLMGVAPEAVEQTGVTVRTPISVGPDTSLGNSGLLFDGQRHRTDQSLSRLRRSDVLQQPAAIDSVLSHSRGDSRTSLADTQRNLAEQQFAQEQQAQIVQLRRQIKIQSRGLQPVTGQATLANLHTEQATFESTGGKATISLLELGLKFIGIGKKRQHAAAMFAQRQAQKAAQKPKGPGSIFKFEGAGAESKADMVAQMTHEVEMKAPHELTAGE